MIELVTGGSGSGKSAYAEEHICRIHRIQCRKAGRRVPLFYIAAMIPRDEETGEKIRKHRKNREGKGFRTLEWHMDLDGKLKEMPLPEDACVLLECLSNLTANEMYEEEGAGEDTEDAVVRAIRTLGEHCAALTVVTNEVFSDVSVITDRKNDECGRYKRILGSINQRISLWADQVTEVVFGIPCRVKGGPEINLVTGGAFQGKYRWAVSEYPYTEWTDGEDCPLDILSDIQGMNHFHVFIRRWIEAGKTKEELVDQILERQGKLVLVTDDVGCGLVPVNEQDRIYREAAGRICTQISASAVRVDRVICGLPQRLK